MRRKLFGWFWLALFVLLAPGPVFARTDTSVLGGGAFSEDFTSYQHLGEAHYIDWNPWRGDARLLVSDTMQFIGGDPLKLADGSTLVTWADKTGSASNGGHSTLYLQRFDAACNRLWPQDIQIAETDSEDGFYMQGSYLGVDDQGNIFMLYWVSTAHDQGQSLVRKMNGQGQLAWEIPLGPVAPWEETQTLAVAADGSFGVAWSSGGGVYVRRFAPNGTAQWTVQISQAGGISLGGLAADPAGNLWVGWTVASNDSASQYVQGLNPSGGLLWSAPISPSAYSQPRKRSSLVLAARASGGLFAAWYEAFGDGSHGNLMLQRISAAGQRQWSADTQVNGSSEPFYWQQTRLRAIPGGDALLWWQGTPDRTAYARRVAADGHLPEAEQALFSQPIESEYYNPAYMSFNVSRQSSVFVFQSVGGDYEGWLQSFRADGKPVNKQPQRISRGNGAANQSFPSITSGPGGAAQVAWLDTRRFSLDAVMQRFNPAGTPLNSVDVHLYPQFYDPYHTLPYAPVTAGDAQGSLVMAWVAPTAQPDAWNLYAEKILSNGKAAWAKPVQLATLSEWKRPGIAVDAQGSIYVAWSKSISLNESVLQVQKLGADGKPAWAQPVSPGVTPPPADSLWQLEEWPVLDAGTDGSILAAWEYGDVVDAYEVFEVQLYLRMQRITPQGQPLWNEDISVNLGRTADTNLREAPLNFDAASADSGGSAYLAYTLYEDTPQGAINWLALMRYGADGKAAWPKLLDLGQNKMEVSVDGLGQSAVIGWQLSDDAQQVTTASIARVGPQAVVAWQRAVYSEAYQSMSGGSFALAAAGLSDGAVMAAYQRTRPATGNDVFLARFNGAGVPQWSAPRPVANPDHFYASAGWVYSNTVAQTTTNIQSATLSADLSLNGGAVRFLLSADDGAHWDTVTPDQAHTFTNPGKRLRWRVDLKPGSNFHATPILRALAIQYQAPLPVEMDQSMWLPSLGR